MSQELVSIAVAGVSTLASFFTILDFLGINTGNKDFEDKVINTHNELKKYITITLRYLPTF